MLSALDKCNKPSSVCQSLTVSLKASKLATLSLTLALSLSLFLSLSVCLSVCLSPLRHRHQTLSFAALVHRRRPLRFVAVCPLFWYEWCASSASCC